ncbi:MAG: 4Fe-4S dicluster domain-containing protein [Spirochaetia bacterium]|nr:4Fe-4S dicluster domain-containing protein [Spirochaetia bacterium]
MKQYPIYTERTECRDCYKCVRSCPVKAIRVENGSAVVDHTLCIFCGRCVDVCPAKAKKIRNDVSHVKALTASEKRVFVSLAPSYTSEYAGREQQLISALNRLGFDGIRETAVGARHVSAWTDELLKEGHLQGGSMFSTACPVIIEITAKYYPSLMHQLAPLPSPLRAHAAHLRDQHGDDIAVVFIGPCIAKKLESDRRPNEIDAVLTYRELEAWMRSEGIFLDDGTSVPLPSSVPVPQEGFFIPEAEDAAVYAVEGGMIATLEGGKERFHGELVDISGPGHVLSFMQEQKERLQRDMPGAPQSLMNRWDASCPPSASGASGRLPEGPKFVELLACEGGCINGSGCSAAASLVQKKAAALEFVRHRLEGNRLVKKKLEDYHFEGQHLEEPRLEHRLEARLEDDRLAEHQSGMKTAAQAGEPEEALTKIALKDDIPRMMRITPDGPDQLPEKTLGDDVSDDQLEKVMRELGKNSSKDMLNCGGCGYNSCRDFAAAYILGMAEKEMCVTHMRKMAQRKVDVLLRTIPMGVVIVDSRKKIVDCNALFLKMFADLGYEADKKVLSRVAGLPVENFIDMADSFDQILSGSRRFSEERVELDNGSLFVKATFFEIEPGRLAGVIMQDITFPTVKRETVIRKAESVIKKNLESVQQIASLLGENAAETEIILNSMIETFQVPHSRSSGQNPRESKEESRRKADAAAGASVYREG